jgi:microsomal dipeptidase-like Zn-dependent dipeptidase
MMSPSHFFDTDVGGSAHGIQKGGLTDFGRRVIQRMEELGMIVDLAHASLQTIDDVLTIATRPAVVSHTGVRGVCNTVRNLSDEHLKAIAAAGGIIGIAYFDGATCGHDIDAIVKTIRYAVDVVGPEHVALGSDFDGAVTTPFDAAGILYLTDALLKAGFSMSDIKLIMGENVRQILLQLLPDE